MGGFSFAAYPYLSTELIGLPGLALAFIIARTWRLEMLFAGMVLVPFSSLALLHQPDFWNPKRLGGMSLGVEDALYLFQSGAFAFLGARLVRAEGGLRRLTERVVWNRLAIVTSLGAAALAAARSAGLSMFDATVVTMVAVTLAIVAIRPKLTIAGLAGALCYGSYHYANLRIGLALWPDFANAWSPGYWAEPMLGVPRGELAFALALGAAHPLTLLFALHKPAGLTSDPSWSLRRRS